VAGGILYAADFALNCPGPVGGGGTVTPISLATGKPGRPVRVGKDPDALAVADGTLYVANHGDGTVKAVKIG
jgi:hypothetical protein